MSFNVFIAALVTGWVLTIAAGVLVFVWSFSRRHFWPGLVLAVLAVLGSYFALTHIHITSSQTTNGHLVYSLDSRWFFMASLGLNMLALAHALWLRWQKSRRTG